MGSRRSSLQSKTSRHSRTSRQRSSKHQGSDATLSLVRPDTGTTPLKDRPFAQFIERAPSPPPGRYLTFEFEVQDSGPGIPEHLQQQIFEPFVQGDLGLSKKYGGTGLGLSICSQLAGLMRGGMSVRSTVGEGSTFTMKIPLRHTQSRADSNAQAVPSKIRPGQLATSNSRIPQNTIAPRKQPETPTLFYFLWPTLHRLLKQWTMV